MTTHEDDQAFASAAAKKLRAEETEVSPEIRERLVAARRAAIREMESRTSARHFSGTRWLVPAGGLAAALAIALLWPQGPTSLPDLDENELAAATEMEMLDEIELVAWMLEMDSLEGDSDAG